MDEDTRRLLLRYGTPAAPLPPPNTSDSFSRSNCFATDARLSVAPSGAVESPARPDEDGGKPPWTVPCAERPANPFRLTELLTGIAQASERDVEAVFGMSFDRVIARGGPLYDPDLAKLRANVPVRAAGGPPVARPPSKSGSPVVPTVTIAKAPLGPVDAARFALPKTIDRASLAPIQKAAIAPEPARPVATGSVARSGRPFRELRDPAAILAAMGSSSALWAAQTAFAQTALLYRAGTPASSVDLWAQWNALNEAYVARGVGPASGAYSWLIGAPYLEAGDGPLVIDPCQGVVGNCFYIASLAGAAWVKPSVIRAANWRGGASRASPADVTFYMPGAATPDVSIRADERYPTQLLLAPADPTTGDYPNVVAMPFCRPREFGTRYWAAAYEKAMAVWRNAGSQTPNMSSHTSFYVDDATHPAVNIAGGLGNSVIVLWRGMDVTWRFITDHCEMSSIGDRRATAIMLPSSSGTPPGVNVVPRHAYTLLGYRLVRGTLGQQQVVLRNPWGRFPPGSPGDNTGTWMGLNLGENGVGVMNLEPFHNSFNQITGNWYGPRTEYDYGTNERWRSNR